ncbi:hypothetical protein TMatcc_003454 [Talaromyces marneffei ATCC 18224]
MLDVLYDSVQIANTRIFDMSLKCDQGNPFMPRKHQPLSSRTEIPDYYGAISTNKHVSGWMTKPVRTYYTEYVEQPSSSMQAGCSGDTRLSNIN